MARAAVGLFESSVLVDQIVHDLEAGGFLRGDIRILREPREIAGSGNICLVHIGAT